MVEEKPPPLPPTAAAAAIQQQSNGQPNHLYYYEEEQSHHQHHYRLYKRRWFVLLSLFLFNISNNVIWISYSAVATKAAAYYQKSADEIDLLSSITFYVGLPFCFIVTYAIDKIEMRLGLLLGLGGTALGGLIRLVSTLPVVQAQCSLDTQYNLGLVAQVLAGITNPVSVSLPTRVSQNWFSGTQQAFATVVLAMSAPLGVMTAQAMSPLIVNEAADIPTLNWAVAILPFLTLILCAVTVTSSYPPTAPSKSADVGLHKLTYWISMKKLLTNPRYLLVNMVVGSAIGFFNCFATQTQQMLCSVGYSDEFSGLVVVIILLSGLVGSLIISMIANKSGRILETAKLSQGIGVLALIFLLQLFREPDFQAAIIVFGILFGSTAFGFYTLAFELSVEVSFPIDQTFGTAMIFLSGQLQGALLIVISEALNRPLSPTYQKIQVCSKKDPSLASDHTNFIVFAGCYLAFNTVIFVIFQKAELLRTKANIEEYQDVEENSQKTVLERNPSLAKSDVA